MKISLNAVPKPQHVRRTPKRVDRGKFSVLTTQHIFERDNCSCVRCGTSSDLESVPHHIIYKSAMGLGEKSNGCVTCRTCHREAHSLREVRQWFEQYRLAVLIPYYEMRKGAIQMTQAELVAENKKLKAIIAKIGKLNLDEITPSKLIAILRELHESK